MSIECNRGVPGDVTHLSEKCSAESPKPSQTHQSQTGGFRQNDYLLDRHPDCLIQLTQG